MQNPETGELYPLPDDDPKNAPPGWPIYRIGERVKFKGWWWEIVSIYDGCLAVKPVKKATYRNTRPPKKRRRRR